jgi:hypothetical protein
MFIFLVFVSSFFVLCVCVGVGVGVGVGVCVCVCGVCVFVFCKSSEKIFKPLRIKSGQVF